MKKKKIPLVLAYVYIVLSVGAICGPAYYGLKSYYQWKHSRTIDPSYTIKTIVQSTEGGVMIPSQQLGQIMGITPELPQNLFAFDLKVAKKKLKSYPVIKRAKLKKVKPSTIYIDYQLHKPYFRLMDYENMAVDTEGVVFPLKPLYQEENFPEVLLGLPSFGADADKDKRQGARWNTPLNDPYSRLALTILPELLEYQKRGVFQVKKVDLSFAYAPSYGKREILVTIEEELSVGNEVKYIFPKVLRLSTKDYSKQLGDFLVLHEKMMADYKKQLQLQPKEKGIMRFIPTTVDLRISPVAFIDNY